MAAVLTAVTDSVHFAQTDYVNWTLVTGGDGVLLIDAGFPGHRNDVIDSVRRLGLDVGDIEAILLTHAHVDHFGSAIWFADTHGIPVFCHPAEVGHSRREYLEQVSPLQVARQVWRPRWAKWAVEIAGKGGLMHDGIATTAAFTEDVAAGLPGTPQAIPTPGHTGGHCSYLVDGVLISGDALVTSHPLLTDTRPQLLPTVFNHDQDSCLRSLHTLGALETDVVLPGHGPIWRGSIRVATERAAADI